MICEKLMKNKNSPRFRNKHGIDGIPYEEPNTNNVRKYFRGKK